MSYYFHPPPPRVSECFVSLVVKFGILNSHVFSSGGGGKQARKGSMTLVQCLISLSLNFLIFKVTTMITAQSRNEDDTGFCSLAHGKLSKR